MVDFFERKPSGRTVAHEKSPPGVFALYNKFLELTWQLPGPSSLHEIECMYKDIESGRGNEVPDGVRPLVESIGPHLDHLKSRYSNLAGNFE